MEEFSVTNLCEAARAFFAVPLCDGSAEMFLHRVPLLTIISALETKYDDSAFVNTVVACLEWVFQTKYGASLIPHYMQFVQPGLHSDAPLVRYLACKMVFYLLENVDETSDSAAQLITRYNIYPDLLDCLIDGYVKLVKTAIDAIKSLASSCGGIDIIFGATHVRNLAASCSLPDALNPLPDNICEFGPDSDGATRLKNLATHSSPQGRIQVLTLIVKLIAVSTPVATIIFYSNLHKLLEEEFKRNDPLTTMSVLTLCDEWSEIPDSSKTLLRTNLLEFITSLISDSENSILRSRATLISGKILSSENKLLAVSKSSVTDFLSVIYKRLVLLKCQNNMSERKATLAAVGLIGSSIQGAELLFSESCTVASHIVHAAFDWQRQGEQQVALIALGNICGETRSEKSKLISKAAELSLQRLIYGETIRNFVATPSDLFLSILQQSSEIRLVAYRLIIVLLARSWCLRDVCLKQKIIDFVTDAHIESTADGREAQYKCCKAIQRAISPPDSSFSYPIPGEKVISAKLLEAVRMFEERRSELQPVVMTTKRFKITNKNC